MRRCSNDPVSINVLSKELSPAALLCTLQMAGNKPAIVIICFGHRSPLCDQDRSNIRSFYLRQREALVRFLTQRTRDAALAEDLAQEAWIRVSQAGGVAAIENPQAYLFRIASNLITDHSRAVARRRLFSGRNR